MRCYSIIHVNHMARLKLFQRIYAVWWKAVGFKIAAVTGVSLWWNRGLVLKLSRLISVLLFSKPCCRERGRLAVTTIRKWTIAGIPSDLKNNFFFLNILHTLLPLETHLPKCNRDTTWSLSWGCVSIHKINLRCRYAVLPGISWFSWQYQQWTSW